MVQILLKMHQDTSKLIMFFRRCCLSFAASAILYTICLVICPVFPSLAFDGDMAVSIDGISQPVYQYIPGDTFSYRIDYSSVSESDFSALFEDVNTGGEGSPPVQMGLAQKAQTSFTGQLKASIIFNEGNDFVIAFKFINSRVTVVINEQPSTEQENVIREAFILPIFGKVSHQGQLQALLFDTAIDRRVKLYAKALLAQIQFVLPRQGTVDTSCWKVIEDDPSGRYVANYTFKPGVGTNGNQKYLKKKLHYLKFKQPETFGKKIFQKSIVPLGALKADFDIQKGYLLSLKGSETQTMLMSEKKVSYVENTIDLNFQEKGKLNDSILNEVQTAYLNLGQSAYPEALTSVRSDKETDDLIEKSELGQETLDTLLDLLAQAEEDQQDYTSLYLKFKALIYLQPENCEYLSSLIGSADPKSLTMRLLSSALGAVGNLQAQEAIIKAIQERTEDSKAVFILLRALSQVPFPKPATEKTLRDLASGPFDPQIKSTALLVLGTMAHKLITISPERSKAIVSWVVSEFDRTEEESRQRLLLLVLGNSGSVFALPMLKQFSRNPSSDLRGAAIQSLRRIDSDEADVLLARALTSDPDHSVRLDAIYALSYREPTFLTLYAQISAFLDDKKESVRLALLNNLAEFYYDIPEVELLVQQAALRDSSTKVQEKSLNIIEQFELDIE